MTQGEGGSCFRDLDISSDGQYLHARKMVIYLTSVPQRIFILLLKLFFDFGK